jgi:hypothetical protein
MNLLACVLPRRVMASSSFRSSFVNVTRYLGDMASSIFDFMPRYHIYQSIIRKIYLFSG